MYVRLVRFSLGPGSRTAAEDIAGVVVPAIKAQDGLEGVTFFGDDADGEYGLFVLWDSEDHANTAAVAVGPKLQGALSGVVKGPPDIRLFEVLHQ